MKKTTVILILAAMLLSFAETSLAVGYAWQDHAAPFDFLFGNHIDGHQQSQQIDEGLLQGFFYIRFTGGLVDGVPEATHADCDAMPDACTPGWVWHGVPVEARLIAKGEHMHPTWCVDPADIPGSPGYSHFHWLDATAHAGGLDLEANYPGYLLKLTAVDTFIFQHHDGFLVTPGIDEVTHANVITDCP